ncbi:MAG: hypothetical protein BKP49_08430 [Treponema sp. CETP13]|nr:MAG: hypothetical protein BKP49_08430 [Treponema sp. CETP13]
MELNKYIPSWLAFVAHRFSRVDRKGRSSLTGTLATLGIAFGVMTLIVVMAVMNGFQAGSIQSILEISSYHVRASIPEDSKMKENLNYQYLSQKLANNPLVSSVSPFIEAQSLIVNTKTAQQGVALLRFVPHDILTIDESLADNIQLIAGNFLDSKGSIVLGYTLAQSLGVRVGDKINLMAMSGNSNVELFAQNRIVTVSGVFSCLFAEINSSFAFLRLDDSSDLLGDSIQPKYGIKLYDSNNAGRYVNEIKKKLQIEGVTNLNDDIDFETWEHYNRSFFGALRVEKNVLMLLVLLIFIVVAINIFNSMRRMIYERREEISILSAFGASKKNIQRIFLVQGFRIGFLGAFSGLLLGLLISVRMDAVFEFVAKISYGVQYFFVMLINPAYSSLLSENPMFSYYAQTPSQPRFEETAIIVLFGVISAVAASWFASRHILKLSVAEVLRDE